MKNIFFYSNIKVYDKSIGITKKVFSQIRTLRSMGYKVYYTGYLKDGVAVFNDKNNIIKKEKYPTKIDIINRYLRRQILIKNAERYIRTTNINLQYAYLRFHFFDRDYLNLLKTLKNHSTKIIIEAHGYPYRRKGINKMIPIYVKDMIYEPFARKYIDLVAAISNYENIWRCKTIHIDNAINLNEIKLKKKRKADGVIKLISVSNEQIYHGYPKLVKGLYSYYNNGGKRKIKIYFVGEFRKQTKKLVDKLGMTENIYFLGKKYDEELESIYDCVDLGIGALGLHSGSEYGSSIKTKEYFAKGIPFINGWKEYAFDDNYPYVKRFNVYSEMIDFNQVVDFYDNIKDDENLQLKMREFAEKNYTWEIMMKRVFDNV